ncbi:MAG: TIGR02611 family protein [Candidatus Saccharimonas sp.]
MARLPNSTRKALTAFVGWSVLLLGIVMIPYPGPGWVVVFIGLSILAREFQWASDLHDYGHEKYSQWQRWLTRQPLYIKSIFWCLTTLTVVVTIWLINGYGMLNAWFNLGLSWAESPFIR